jgi:hypothetical protein
VGLPDRDLPIHPLSRAKSEGVAVVTWEHDVRASLRRLRDRGFTGDILAGERRKISPDSLNGLLGELYSARNRYLREPSSLAVSRPLEYEGLPVETIYGIPLVFDVTVPPGQVELRNEKGCRVGVFNLGDKKGT